MTADVLPALTAGARTAAHPAGTPCTHHDSVLADRRDGTVVRHGDTVAKAHAPGTDPAELSRRLELAAHPALTGILLAPLRPKPVDLHGRLVTFWPYGCPGQGCCSSEGHPMGLPGTSVLAAAATYAGL
ncbi:hypothetical protein ABT086_27640, partial [Streptomyces mirabilis]